MVSIHTPKLAIQMILSPLLLVLALTATSRAFTLVPAVGPAPSTYLPSTTPRWPSTCLRAEADEDADDKSQEEPEASSSDTDILNSPEFLKRKLDVLKSDFQKAEQDFEDAKQRLEEGKAEWGPQIDELQKEYQNIQQRMNTQSSQGDSMATLQVARQMLDLLDNYDRAFGAVSPETDEEKSIEAEYKQTYESVLATLDKLGVEEVETVGVPFDFEIHQAVMQKPSDEYEEGIVCEELQKGFKCGDQLVRAAMVAVAA